MLLGKCWCLIANGSCMFLIFWVAQFFCSAGSNAFIRGSEVLVGNTWLSLGSCIQHLAHIWLLKLYFVQWVFGKDWMGNLC